ncbi:MAG: IS630 family transposase [Methylobacterium sp.]
MPKVVAINLSHTPEELRRLAARGRDANQSRRLLSIAAVLDGMSRADAARIGGMDRQTLRDWVHRFNERGPDGLKDNWRRENPRRLSSAQQAELAQIVETGPDRAVHGVVRWRRVDLQRLIAERFGVAYHERTIGKLLKAMGFSHMSARPRHPMQDGATIEAFKKNFRRTLAAHLQGVTRKKKIEIWFQDEARIGQKNGLVRQWARRGTRPRQPADQRYESAYLFGAICPARGVAAGLALPFADTEAMQLHIDEIALHVAKGAHAVLLLDRAGWHTTGNLAWPKNVTPILLPSRSPELNPVEQVWQFLRANFLSNRAFETYDDIIDAASDAWQRFVALPETITSIGLRDWAHGGQS